ncbi:MAG: type II toxin-antitoxin system VapB family antitoxin [Acidobacteriota bacterium]
MRTTLDIDKKLLEEAIKFSPKKTKTSTVNEALKEYVIKNKIKKLISLRGKIKIEDRIEELRNLEIKELSNAEKNSR